MSGPDFLCCGMPKSGTTMLQRMLDMHPDVSCPSEHRLVYLQERLDQLFEDYNNHLRVLDRRTGGQGIRPVDKAARIAVLRASAGILARAAGRGKRICELNDNALMEPPDRLKELFPESKAVVIFRHPLNLALSARRYNHMIRKMETYPSLAPREPGPETVAPWIEKVVRQFVATVDILLGESTKPARLFIVRYEELIAARGERLAEILEFLGATTDSAIIARIAEDSSFERMRSASREPDFFVSGGVDYKVPEAMRAQVERIAGDAMRRVGYAL